MLFVYAVGYYIQEFGDAWKIVTTIINFCLVLCQPPKIRSFINSVTAVPLENIEEPIKGFVWEYDKVVL